MVLNSNLLRSLRKGSVILEYRDGSRKPESVDLLAQILIAAFPRSTFRAQGTAVFYRNAGNGEWTGFDNPHKEIPTVTIYDFLNPSESMYELW